MTPKTLEEHRTYLYDIVKLKLFFVHSWLSSHPDESFSSVIRNRVDIYRKTEANPGPHTPSELFFDAPAWLDMEREAETLYKKYRSDEETFERLAFEVFRESTDRRCERDYLDTSVLARYQCGSLRHELAPDVPGGTLVFHIANAIRPRSIFEDRSYLYGCFDGLLEVASSMGAKYIGTGTWLNSHKLWLSYFPQEWIDNMTDEDRNPCWAYNFWGQFINARGTFNTKYGKYMRETKLFPYYPRYSFCSLDAMRSMFKQ